MSICLYVVLCLCLSSNCLILSFLFCVVGGLSCFCGTVGCIVLSITDGSSSVGSNCSVCHPFKKVFTVHFIMIVG